MKIRRSVPASAFDFLFALDIGPRRFAFLADNPRRFGSVLVPLNMRPLERLPVSALALKFEKSLIALLEGRFDSRRAFDRRRGKHRDLAIEIILSPANAETDRIAFGSR